MPSLFRFFLEDTYILWKWYFRCFSCSLWTHWLCHCPHFLFIFCLALSRNKVYKFKFFVMTELAKQAKSIFTLWPWLDLDLWGLSTESTCSSNVLIWLWASIIWLDIVKISSKSEVRLPRYCNFPVGWFTPPSCSLRVAKTLYTYES